MKSQLTKEQIAHALVYTYGLTLPGLPTTSLTYILTQLSREELVALATYHGVNVKKESL